MKNKERIEKLELAIDNLRMHVHQLHDELYEEVKENKEIAKNGNDSVKLQIADMVWDGKVKRASEDKEEKETLEAGFENAFYNLYTEVAQMLVRNREKLMHPDVLLGEWDKLRAKYQDRF